MWTSFPDNIEFETLPVLSSASDKFAAFVENYEKILIDIIIDNVAAHIFFFCVHFFNRFQLLNSCTIALFLSCHSNCFSLSCFLVDFLTSDCGIIIWVIITATYITCVIASLWLYLNLIFKSVHNHNNRWSIISSDAFHIYEKTELFDCTMMYTRWHMVDSHNSGKLEVLVN